ncbi:unnamed protein product [Miscanthus lutarioriparius]|uniref:Sororin C-terminal region domain-containing protein n=1 Tax=Miscanthus lutarioriparius TaxID=422564 RepID=A0A811SRI7_9POAL|nr:unnamed protein product [Miscanthus lutarioriparius]
MRPSTSAAKRQRKAVPLGDVTNLLRPETPTPIKPRRTARRPLPAPSDASAVSSTCSSSASVTPALKPYSSASARPAPEPSSSAPVTPAPQPSSSATVTAAPKPSSTASATPALEPSSATTVTPAPKPSFAAVLDEVGSVFESPTICTVYARRRTTEAEAEAEGRINPTITNKGKEPVGAAASCPPLGKSTKNIRKKDTRPISSSATCREAKKERPLARTPKLPEEFVKKQRAYFADVDAFELAEEEVSESELE